MEISYNKRIFKLNSRTYIKQRKLTYKCINNKNNFGYNYKKNNKILWINNYKLSCATDSFLTIFIFTLYTKLKNENYKNDSNYIDDFNQYIFNYFIYGFL